MLEPKLDLALPARFKLLGHLGSGGMGAVYAALDSKTGAQVALKTLHASSPDALLALKNEFRSLQDVMHPNLVSLLDLVEESGRFFVAMELVNGVDLLAYVRPGFVPRLASGMSETRRVDTPATPKPVLLQTIQEPQRTEQERDTDTRLRAALVQLARGLCALHDSGKLHRDVKPSNILVTPEGRVVLVDFGLTTELSGRSGFAERRAVGTRAFMAPEQAAGQRVTAAADWFSVGVVMYLALTGALPYQGADVDRRRVQANFRPVWELAPDTAEDLSTLCAALLDVDPALRPDGRRVLEWLGALAVDAGEELDRALFVGRSAELEALRFAAETSRQHAVTCFVVGDSGVGKSTLVREALARIAVADALVLSGRCYERELVPYKALDGIIDALSHALLELDPGELERVLPEQAAILARLFPVLGRVPGFSGGLALDHRDPLELRDLAFSALRQLFSKLSEHRLLLLCIDDLQWADQDSHLLLSDLLREPASPRVSVIVTARPPVAGAPDRIAALAERLHDVRRIALSPLDSADARRLAESVLGTTPDAMWADAIALESAGHPLFVVALAQHAGRGRALSFGSLRLDDALFARVQDLTPEARRLLEFVAVAGCPLEAELLQQLADLELDIFALNAHALRAARLTRSTTGESAPRIESYHDRIRETVLTRLGDTARRACHRRLAEVLESSGRADREPQLLVRHLEGAGLAERAARQAELAAVGAEGAFAFDQAAELYRTALRLGQYDPEAKSALNLKLAEALTNAGRAAEAARAYLLCAATETAEKQLIYRRFAADRMLRSGHLEEGLTILSTVLAQFGEALPSQRRALLIRLWYRLRAQVRGLAHHERAPSAVPPSMLQRIDAYHAVGVSLALIDPIRGGAFEARALELALDAGEPRRLAEILVMESGYRGAISAGGQRSTRPLLALVSRIARATQDPYVTAISTMIDGHLRLHAGEFAHAAALLLEVQPAFRRLPGTYFEQAFCHCFRLICLRNRGQLAELQRGFFDWLQDAERRGDRFTEASLRFNLNNIWLARDQPEEALRDLERVTWVTPSGGYHVQHWYEQHARAEVLLYSARAAAGLPQFRRVFEQLSRSFILRMRLHRGVALWLLGRLILSALAESRARAGALREVSRLADKLWRQNQPHLRTWALLLRASVAAQRGQLAAARETLLRAIEHAELADLPQCAAAARFRLADFSEPEARRALLEHAHAWCEAQQIRNPPRMLSVWAPGF